VSGGGAVVQMPGCLSYAVVLRADGGVVGGGITATHRYVLARVAEAASQAAGRPVVHQGDSDLAVNDRKCCGNAQRRLRQAVLVHGTFLLNADLTWMDRLLPAPSRQPEYRRGRAHRDFVVNLGVAVEALEASLGAVWGAARALTSWPEEPTARLAREKYGRAEWNLKH